MNRATAHSEYGQLKSVFIKRSKEAFVNNQHLADHWKSLNYIQLPNFEKANDEYGAFESVIKSNVEDVHFLPLDSNVNMDSIYCRDASIATDKGMIICRMGKEGRMNEPAAEKKAFVSVGIPILGEIKDPGTVEGGDVAWLDDRTLAIGHTYRTNEEGIDQIRKILFPLNVEVITVPLPHYHGPTDVFHLMSILSPVDKDLAVVYSPLMPIGFRNELLRRGFELIEVPDQEFESMACNVLAVAPRKCVMVKGNPKTKSLLQQAGCEVIEYDGNEISVKGGGGPTCLTRPISRLI